MGNMSTNENDMLVTDTLSDVIDMLGSETAMAAAETDISVTDHSDAVIQIGTADDEHTSKMQITFDMILEDYACPICLEILTNPKIMTCSGEHTICHRCFISNKCQCPLCRKSCSAVSNKILEQMLHHVEESGACGEVYTRKNSDIHRSKCMKCMQKQIETLEEYALRLENIIEEQQQTESSIEIIDDRSLLRQYLQWMSNANEDASDDMDRETRTPHMSLFQFMGNMGVGGGLNGRS